MGRASIRSTVRAATTLVRMVFLGVWKKKIQYAQEGKKPGKGTHRRRRSQGLAESGPSRAVFLHWLAKKTQSEGPRGPEAFQTRDFSHCRQRNGGSRGIAALRCKGAGFGEATG